MRINRQDVSEKSHVPRRIQELVRRLGGRNCYGEAMYRLLRAETRTVKSAGSWTQWAENLPPSERTGLGITKLRGLIEQGQRKLLAMAMAGSDFDQMRKVEAAQVRIVRDMLLSGDLGNKPKNVVVGMIDRKLYTFPGWILEKWKPAAAFGSPADWYGFRFQGQCAIGEYPYYGDYELVAGPTPHCLNAKEVETAIRGDYRQVQGKSGSPLQRALLALNAMEAELKRQNEAQISKVADLAKEDSPLMNRLSLGAGRIREAMAAKAGLRGGDYGN